MAPPFDEGPSSRFCPAMYAGRAIPLGVAVAVAVWLAPAPSFLILLLGAAVVAQVADVLIGAVHRLPGMVAGGVLAVVCHGTAIVTQV